MTEPPPGEARLRSPTELHPHITQVAATTPKLLSRAPPPCADTQLSVSSSPSFVPPRPGPSVSLPSAPLVAAAPRPHNRDPTPRDVTLGVCAPLPAPSPRPKTRRTRPLSEKRRLPTGRHRHRRRTARASPRSEARFRDTFCHVCLAWAAAAARAPRSWLRRSPAAPPPPQAPPKSLSTAALTFPPVATRARKFA